MQVKSNNLISQIASTRVLDAAYDWLRALRLDAQPNNPFWSLSLYWPTIRAQCRLDLQAGDYRFSPLTQLKGADGDWVTCWEPLDLIVQKAMAMVLTPWLDTKMDLAAATHLPGHGGLKKAVVTTQRYARNNSFVLKTDIADYYASMQHHVLHNQLCQHIDDQKVQGLLWQVMDPVHVCGGAHRQIKTNSIARGCPLSPLFAAVYLQPVDALIKKHKLDYVRYMDDFVIMTHSRHQLKRILKQLYTLLTSLGLKLATAKTWLGRVRKGIAFLGYEISPSDLSLSARSFDRMCVRFRRLYEQGAPVARLTKYVNNWIKWARSGVSLDVEKLKLKTTKILQTTFHIRVPLHRI